ncbi:MAG: Hpt domain-containing protein, partial [Spirochaetes bacterium]|nr:Hpt domain-containing protein [Spirochaetota bacterium]
MADNYSQFLGVFLGEASENLESLEQGLLELEAKPGDASLLNAIFRAAHTIKGSAGLVGQKGIQDFTHILENLLDRVRSGQVAADGGVISTVLASADVIKRMVANLSAGRPAETGIDLDRAFDALRRHEPLAGGAAAAPGKTGGRAEEAPRLHRTHLNLKYGSGILGNGIDPLMFLEDLDQAGKILAIEDDPSSLPPWEAFNPEAWSLGWKVLHESTQPVERLKEIFLFVSDESELRLTDLTESVNAADRAALAEVSVRGQNPADLAAPDRRGGSDRRLKADRRAGDAAAEA